MKPILLVAVLVGLFDALYGQQQLVLFQELPRNDRLRPSGWIGATSN